MPKSKADLDKFLERSVPILVKRYILDARALKACSVIAPAFAFYAREAGFEAFYKEVPRHFISVVYTSDGPFVVDLSYIQFEFCPNYEDPSLPEDDDGGRAERRELERLLRKVEEDPFSAIQVKPYQGTEYGLIDPTKEERLTPFQSLAERIGSKDIRPWELISMNNRKLVIAALERELRKEAFGANKFQDFVSKFSDLAVKSGDSFLLKFSDKLISYPDFMRESDPVEFSQHFVRNVKPQGSAYRDSLSSESTARSILDKVVRKLEQLQGKFATQASDFFRQASNAIRLP